jgi:hypothetical protein
MIGQRLVQREAELPADAEAIGCHAQEFPLGAQSFEEEHELEAKESHRVNGRTASGRGAVCDPLPNEGEIKLSVQVAVEVISGDQRLQGGKHRTVKGTSLWWAKHRG